MEEEGEEEEEEEEEGAHLLTCTHERMSRCLREKATFLRCFSA